MKPKKVIEGTITLTEDFTESVNEMIAEGVLESDEDIRDYIRDLLVEDIVEFTNISGMLKFTFEMY